jgi:SUMO ligase MMS21 Smc5/6 complex component
MSILWDMVGLVLFMILIMILSQVCIHVFDMPEWIAKRFNRKPTRDELETRLQDLESRLNQVEAKLP